MAKKARTAKSNESVNFEEALEQLETIVRKMEQGNCPLEESLDEYAKAIQLLKACHQALEKAERKIEILSGVDAQGNPVTQPVEESEGTLEQKQRTRSTRRSAKSQQSNQAFAPSEDDTDENNSLF